MPRMNGAQLAAGARQVRPELPVLLATGYAELPAGSGVSLPRISKPYQQDQLAAEIMKVMTQSAAIKSLIEIWQFIPPARIPGVEQRRVAHTTSTLCLGLSA